MSNTHELIGYLKTQMQLNILATTMYGSLAREVLGMPNTSPQDLLGRGFDDNEISTAVEVSFELERLIRSGRSLSQALVYMRKHGWLQRINEEVK
ncbi:hypothetical protein [Psychrobacter lutiphocae]|uniref:hypothetical protein n=1 Tax=Psychrobacter lutiphocae TaxID=540500 RepID=UPI00037E4B3B|nr:hypothetical protein [Psychrobacter lutiphocae]